MTALVAYLMSILQKTPTVRKNKYDLPLPDTCHLDLGEDVVGGRAVFVVGDVHGCLEELQDMIQVVKKMEAKVLFLFVGDLINRGPSSIGVLRLIQSGEIDCYAVRGNHEEIVLKEYRFMKNDPNYVLRTKHKWIKDMTTQDHHFLSQLPFTIGIPSLNSIVVHAGIVPGLSLDKQSLVALTRMRNIIEEDYFDGGGLVFSNKPDRGVPWSSLWPGPQHVYFGHDARRGFRQYDFATCLDTGCQYGNKLTGIFINGCQKLVSVKARRVYCVGKPE
ncbi:bis(5'-nucleosyl)-tetraphosphatase PrpE [asymmetrical]-like isoform X2 [Haliotis rufescens]|uniref:bis(5'-nucleosyl)-tetraphosphatase PrpE [asymmetrical]-like isoform X2 n=1 Tax=Haliotis rufescens TaxID=6454 RepID=UPI00201ECD58|nr:bis(5'-nucleosyl)-tetraphosphatase PrpE [asymmetrical]-like isoform X2 [Haliotis rufescens]XP_046361406.2 bis(5'-nucleosyl)-tetraphosphatase PrpE [asymmetrical]-like isoform X2 [Haliotis rufescens]